MFGEEIEVPKEIRQFMMAGAEETVLGQKNGARRQYRYGRLHIREYDGRYLVHMDRVDPRKRPLAHLVYDAPEVLVGLSLAGLGSLLRIKPLPLQIAGSLLLGIAGYAAAKKLKDLGETRYH